MLKIQNLTKKYGDFKAVDNLSLHIESGDIYGFIGHNGAGKTTTIKAVAGILNFEEGEIFIDGKNIKKSSIDCKRVMAYIPDNPDIYDYLTGVEYLNFVLDMFGVENSVREERITYYAKEFEIYNNLTDLISSYSHGMKQKLVLISALIHTPKLLVLDEPFVGLDPTATFKVKNIMKELCSKGMAIFFSTHVLEVAEKLCNKIAIIKDGKLVATGITNEVLGDKSLEETFLALNGKQND